MKAALAIVAGFAASVMGHGFVTNFTTDGKNNQGFLRKSHNSSLSFALEFHAGLAHDAHDEDSLTIDSGLLLPESEHRFLPKHCRLVRGKP